MPHELLSHSLWHSICMKPGIECVSQGMKIGKSTCQLFLHHTDLSITFESPSELDLNLRIATHLQAIDTFVKG